MATLPPESGPDDPRRIVAEGYDRIAERYAAWAATGVVDSARPRYTDVLLARVPPGGAILDLGCGNGVPTTRRLAGRFVVTGVDISARQIELARRNVPEATFVHADLTRLTFPPGHFDAVVAFYSLIHLPHGELPGVLARIATWLRPGGLFVASMGASSNPGMVEADWLGAPMYFSGYSLEDGRASVEAAGLEVLRMTPETILEDGSPVVFGWLVARGRLA